MRLGVLVLPTDPWPVAVERARAIEALGYHHLWTYDHLSWRWYRDEPWHAAMPWLTGVAAATSSIRLGTMVASPNFRHPVTFAKETMTLDHISGGRLTIGFGGGGTGFDATALGGEPISQRERTARLGEFLAMYDALLREPVYSHRGEFYAADEVRMIPGCVQRPRVPIAVSAVGPKSLGFAARHGDAWLTFFGPDPAGDASPAEVEKKVRSQADELERQCELIGRDPAELQRICLVGNAGERPMASLEAFSDYLGRYAALGFTDLVFHDPRASDPVWNEDPSIVDAIAERFLQG